MLEFYFRFEFLICIITGTSLCISIANFVLLPVSIFTFASSSACHFAPICQISSKSDFLRQSYDVILIFSRWRSRHRNSASGFVFRDFAYLGRSKSTCIPNLGKISQYTAEILLLQVSERQTSAMLQFYFRCRLSRLCHHRRGILQLPAKFRSNRTIRGRVMTSYPFSMMAATASQFYFWFRF